MNTGHPPLDDPGAESCVVQLFFPLQSLPVADRCLIPMLNVPKSANVHQAPQSRASLPNSQYHVRVELSGHERGSQFIYSDP